VRVGRCGEGAFAVEGAYGDQKPALKMLLALLDHTTSTSPGAYDDPNAGDPIQYDEVRIEHDQGEVEIVVYNRAIPERRRGQALRDRQQGYQGEHGGRPGGERTMTQPAETR